MTTKQQDAESAAHNHEGRIGASRAPAILGLDSYTTPYQAWEEIMGRPKEESLYGYGEAAHWGTVMEDTVVREGYQHRTGLKTQRVNRQLHHPDHPFITASLDRRVLPASLRKTLQIKCRDRFVRDRWGSPETDQIPEREACQVMVEIEVANGCFPGGIDSEDVGVLFGGNTFEIYTVERAAWMDGTFWGWTGQGLMDALAHWWHVHVEGDQAPDPTTIDDCKRRWSKSSGTYRELSQEDKYVLSQFMLAEQQTKTAEERKEKYRIELMKLLGDDEALVADGKRIVTWREASKFDPAAFTKSNPEIAAQCVKLDTTRLRKEHAKIYSAHKTEGGRGSLTVNRNAADTLLRQ